MMRKSLHKIIKWIKKIRVVLLALHVFVIASLKRFAWIKASAKYLNVNMF